MAKGNGGGGGKGNILPQITISDVIANEGDIFTFTVALDTASKKSISVGYATADMSGMSSDADYSSVSGILTFAPGETTKTITVSTINDLKYEASETFKINLTNPTNATIADGEGVATIAMSDPHIIRDTPLFYMQGLQGTAGEADYFVFDIGGAPELYVTGEAIIGFETGLDKIIAVNVPQGSSYGLGQTIISYLDYSYATPGLTNDPSINDYRVNLYKDAGDGRTWYSDIFAIDQTFVAGDILNLSNDPFMVV